MADDAPPPAGPPPSYESSVSSPIPKTLTRVPTNHLQVPRNGIPPERRRSMEDEARELPKGWVREFDAPSQHQFFVDTRATPPRSIWHHPYDDETYLSTLSWEERETLEEKERKNKIRDVEAESTDEEADHDHPDYDIKALTAAAEGKDKGKDVSQPFPDLPPRPSNRPDPTRESSKSGEKKGFGRRMKDKITGTTHEEREAERARRAEEERKQYAAHQAYRQAMARAIETRQPQLIGKDRDGHDVYIEPPPANYQGGGYGGGGYNRGYGGGAYGYNPYGPQGAYAEPQGAYAEPQGAYAEPQAPSPAYSNPNARFVRPNYPYQRPYGYGYGGGIGLPLTAGLLGGAVLGGLLF
jgi:hypothetical protein